MDKEGDRLIIIDTDGGHENCTLTEEIEPDSRVLVKNIGIDFLSVYLGPEGMESKIILSPLHKAEISCSGNHYYDVCGERKYLYDSVIITGV